MGLFTDTDLSSLPTKDILNPIEVRPILPEEKTRWDELMKAHHYLGFSNLIGEGIRYVAVYQDCWLALLGWASAALCCGPPKLIFKNWDFSGPIGDIASKFTHIV